METAPQGINNPNYDPNAPQGAPGSLDLTIPTPAPTNAPTSPTALSGGTTTPVSESYTVKKGDTLGKIAQKSGISLADLLAGNAQYQKNPNLIRPGQTVNISKKYQDIHAAIKDKPSTDSSAAGRDSIQETGKTLGSTSTTSSVDAFMQSPGVLEIAKQIMSVLDPQVNRDELMAQMTKIKGEQDVLSAEQLQMMNIKNVMSGTTDDIRNEITKAGGSATESQIQAMSAARNNALIKQATFLQDQMSYQQNLVANDTSLLDFEKTMANDQFDKSFKIIDMVQKNQQNMQSAAISAANDIITKGGGYGALRSSLLAKDPTGQQLANMDVLLKTNMANPAWTVNADKYNAAKTAYEQARATAALSNAGLGSGSISVVDTSNLSSTPGTYNSQVLANVPAGTAQIVKQLTDYRIPLPSGFALRSPYWQNILSLAALYDPTFDASQYNVRLKLKQDFVSGKSAQNIRSLNTAIGHLETFKQKADALSNSSIQVWNTISNFGLTATGDPRVTNFIQAKNAVTSELASLFKGTGASDQEIKAWSQGVDASESPEQLTGAIETAVTLMQSRLDALRNQWEAGMGKPQDFDKTFLSSKSQQIITGLGIPLEQGFAAPDNSQSYGYPKGTDGTAYGHPGYVSDGTQWVLQ